MPFIRFVENFNNIAELGPSMSWRALLAAIAVISVLAVAMVASDSDALGPCPPEPFEDLAPHAEFDGRPDGEGPRPGEPPVVVFDASGRPAHSPERMLRDYMGFFSEKRALEGEGRPFLILDPEIASDHHGALSAALESVMGCDVVADLGGMDGEVEMRPPSPGASDLGFLLELLPYLEEDSGLKDLVLSMISELEGFSVQFGTAPYREVDYVSEPPSDSSEEDCETVYDVMAAPSAVETYIRAHVFDGGAIDL